MTDPMKRRNWARWYWSRRGRVLAFVAALPLIQATGCFPDPIGALNFELQSLINSVLINTVSIIVQNLFGL